VTDNFTPITQTAPGTGAPAAPVTTTLPLVAGSATFTPTNVTLGTHLYTFAYSGDSNFQASTTPTANSLLVDNPDFTISSTTGVVNIIPGIVPSGDGLPVVPNQSAAAPETAVIAISGSQGFAGTISLTCAPIGNPTATPAIAPPTYITCTMTPPTVTIAAAVTGTNPLGANQISVFSVSTPATLPLGYFNTAQIRTSATKTVLAFLPFGLLAFCVRRR
jgi:hypothetical protein